MEKEQYRKILIDESIWEKIKDNSDFIQMYTNICIAKGNPIQKSTLYNSKALLQYFLVGSSFSKFLQIQKNMLQDWLYVSQSLENICWMRQYMVCCFVNNGINDCIDISNIHEIREFKDIQKVYR